MPDSNRFREPSRPRARQRARAASLLAIALAAAVVLAACGKRASKPANDPRLAFEPSPGRYSYRTNGAESVDALLGARHRYPRRTGVRVVRRSCGYSERWQPIDQRWTEFSYCLSGDGSRRLVRVLDYHEFFGYPVALSYRCAGSRVPRLDRLRRGFRWTDRCRTGSNSLVLRGSVAAIVPARGGLPSSVHLRVVAHSRGRSDGSNVNDSWLARSNGLLIRRSVRGEARTRTSIGRVRSHERYTLRLRRRR